MAGTEGIWKGPSLYGGLAGSLSPQALIRLGVGQGGGGGREGNVGFRRKSIRFQDGGAAEEAMVLLPISCSWSGAEIPHLAVCFPQKGGSSFVMGGFLFWDYSSQNPQWLV